MSDTQEGRTCRACRELKPWGSFLFSARGSEWGARCRQCRIAVLKKYYAANKEALREKQRAYYAANKEALREKQRAYYAANKEALREKN